jgi:hypothetical protein
MEPQHDSGQSVTGALEGWFPNRDGSFSILLGYYNRNLKEELDIPIGPDNRIEPGGPDRGQPTHFMPRRCKPEAARTGRRACARTIACAITRPSSSTPIR